MHLPFLIVAFVPEGDEHWLNILQLQQTVQLCTTHRVDEVTVGLLEYLICTHNSKFKALYVDASYINLHCFWRLCHFDPMTHTPPGTTQLTGQGRPTSISISKGAVCSFQMLYV